MNDSIRWVANLSLLFTEYELTDRAAAAKAEGFDEVEFWWPFGLTGTPQRSAIDAFTRSVESADVQLTAMNLFAGDMPSGERGVLSYPERTEEFRASVDIAMEIGARLGTRLFNAPYGHRRDGLETELQDRLAEENIAYAAHAAERIGGMILMEPVSKMPLYPVKTAADAVGIIDRVRRSTGVQNLGFLLDQYHVGVSGEDIFDVVQKYADRISHVQIADIPGRGQPGSGNVDIPRVVELLMSWGYEGAFALEYIPATNTAESLAAWRREKESWV